MDVNTKIMITGGTGYLGSNLAEYLADQGHQVTAVGRKDFSFKNKNIHFLAKDVRELNREDVKEFNSIFHLAAVSPNNSKLEPAEIYKQNVESMLHLLELIENISTPIKIIFASSAGVYGRGQKRFSEKDFLSPIDLYACSKASCEQLINVYAKKNPNIKILILRLANVYGPGQKPDFVIPDTFAKISQSYANNSKEIIIFNGQSIRDFIYVDDCIKAITLASDKSLSGTYNIGTGKATRIVDLASQLIVLSKKPLDIKEENQNQDANILNISKIRKEGWVPRTTLKKGLKATYKSYLKKI